MNSRIVFMSVVGLAAYLAPDPAVHAQWAVVDGTNLLQTTATATNTARQIQQLYDQLRTMRQQVDNQLRTLQTLNPRTFSGLLDSIDQARMSYSALTYQVESIGYSVESVNNGFDRLFPRNSKAWKKIPAGRYTDRFAAWNAEITGSSLVAMRAQGNMTNIQKSNEAARQILERSRVADGEVRQLQSMNQMLAVMQNQMSTLIQLLSTGSRVSAELAAAGAGKDMLTQEAKHRRRENYRNKGKPPRRLTRLP